MWPFSSQPTRESLQAHKKVKVLGMRFTIRRLSPLSDFDADSMPQIFTDTTRRAPPDLSTPAAQKRALEDMKLVVQAGVVEPKLSGPGKDGLSVDDVFRDMDVAKQLYFLILEHSLFRVKPWQVPFFFLARQLIRFTVWLRLTGRGPATSPSRANA